MVSKAVVVVKIPLKGLSRAGLCISCVRGTLFFKSVAVVPASSMFGPGAETHPAEFMLAFSTCHVVAASVLFDRRMTFGAFFSVG